MAILPVTDVRQTVMDWLGTTPEAFPPSGLEARPRRPAPRVEPSSTVHITVERAPTLRQDLSNTKWPHGVVQGGIILDMVEYLRICSPQSGNDQDLSLWLENEYIRPFKQIGRLDGLVVRDPLEMSTIMYAHYRYMIVNPMPKGTFLPPQPIWVPGLEPTYKPGSEHFVRWIDAEAPKGGFEQFEMDKNYQVRTGKFLCSYKDTKGWTREIREAPPYSEVEAREQEERKKLAVVPSPIKQARIERQRRMEERKYTIASEETDFDEPVHLLQRLSNASLLTIKQQSLVYSFNNASSPLSSSSAALMMANYQPEASLFEDDSDLQGSEVAASEASTLIAEDMVSDDDDESSSFDDDANIIENKENIGSYGQQEDLDFLNGLTPERRDALLQNEARARRRRGHEEAKASKYRVYIKREPSSPSHAEDALSDDGSGSMEGDEENSDVWVDTDEEIDVHGAGDENQDEWMGSVGGYALQVDGESQDVGMEQDLQDEIEKGYESDGEGSESTRDGYGSAAMDTQDSSD